MYQPLDKTLPALNGLRGLAAIMVLISHAAIVDMLPEIMNRGLGQLGVACFYTLSGFLMAHVTFGRAMTRDSVRSYLVARLARVLPLFYGLLVLNTLMFLVVGAAFYSFETFGDVASNWLLIQGTGVFWSIPIEIHFYILFLGIWLAERRGLLLPLLAVLAVVQILAMGWLEDRLGSTRYLPFWLHFFLLGVLVRWLLDTGRRNILPRPGSLSPPRRRLVAGLGLALFVLILPQVRQLLGWADHRNHIDPVIIAGLPVLLWVALQGSGPFRLLSGRVLGWYGKISFSLYLLHAPLVTVVERLHLVEFLPPLLCFALFFALSSALAALSFQLIEKPAQAWLRRGPRPAAATTQTAPAKAAPQSSS